MERLKQTAVVSKIMQYVISCGIEVFSTLMLNYSFYLFFFKNCQTQYTIRFPGYNFAFKELSFGDSTCREVRCRMTECGIIQTKGLVCFPLTSSYRIFLFVIDSAPPFSPPICTLGYSTLKQAILFNTQQGILIVRCHRQSTRLMVPNEVSGRAVRLMCTTTESAPSTCRPSSAGKCEDHTRCSLLPSISTHQQQRPSAQF
jgi:hypothetical protein